MRLKFDAKLGMDVTFPEGTFAKHCSSVKLNRWFKPTSTMLIQRYRTSSGNQYVHLSTSNPPPPTSRPSASAAYRPIDSTERSRTSAFPGPVRPSRRPPRTYRELLRLVIEEIERASVALDGVVEVVPLEPPVAAVSLLTPETVMGVGGE